MVRVSSRRGTAPQDKVRVTDMVRPKPLFMRYGFPDQVPTIVLILSAIDPQSSTAEPKARAVSIGKV